MVGGEVSRCYFRVPVETNTCFRLGFLYELCPALSSALLSLLPGLSDRAWLFHPAVTGRWV